MLALVVPSIELADAEATGRQALAVAGIPAELIAVPDPERTNCTATVNRGLRQVLERPAIEAVCVLNDDLVPDHSWLLFLWAAMLSDAKIGFAGPSGPSRTPPANSGQRGDEYGIIPVRHVAGSCVLVRREVLETAGLMDEVFILYGADVDWQWRAKRDHGWESVWVRHAYVHRPMHEFRQPFRDHDLPIMLARWGEA